MRIRSIKPEFWRSDDVSALPRDYRLLYVGLWSYVDDNGVGLDRLSSICADLFAQDLENDFEECYAMVRGGLQELSRRGLVVRYEVSGRRYLSIPTWGKHQRIDKPSKPRYPLPDVGCAILEPALSSENGAFLDGSGRAPGWLREGSTPGTGEQGNRGTGEQVKETPRADARGLSEPADDIDPGSGRPDLRAAADEIPEDQEPETADRPEIHALCQLLADLMVSNGCKRPTIGARWLKDMRLLVDRDGRDPEQVERAVRWCQQDAFWKSNIHSPNKLRSQYDRLRLSAERERSGGRPSAAQSKRERALDILRALGSDNEQVPQLQIGM